LPQLLNIIGGTKVRGATPSARATPQPSRPEPNTATTVAPRRGRYSMIWKDLLASAPKISAGTKTSMFSLLAWDRSGRRRRPTMKPTEAMANSGKRMATMRSSMGRQAE